MHVIEVKQDGGNVVVSIDGKQHFTTPPDFREP